MTEEENKDEINQPIDNNKNKNKNKKNIFPHPSSHIVLRKKQDNNIEDNSTANRKITLAKPNPAILSTNLNREQADFLRHKAVLEKLEDGQYYWVLYDTHTAQRIGPVEKATKEVSSCWDPNSPDGIDHTREVRG